MEKKEKKEEVSWNKKRIYLTLVLIILILGGLFAVYAKNYKETAVLSSRKVVAPPRIDLQSGLEDKINNIKAEAGNINVTDIATSSPQVQKVINDLRNLQNYPKNQVRQACENICNNL